MISDAEQLKTSGSEIDTKQVNNLPVSGVRNYTALLALVPGVSPPAPAHTLPANPQESLAASVGGQTGLVWLFVARIGAGMLAIG